MSTNDEPGFGESARSGVPGMEQENLGAAPTQIINDFDATEDEPPATGWHFGLDLGLLILRVAIGGAMVLHGLQKFGMFEGPGMDNMPAALEQMGIAHQQTVLAWILAVTEVGAGGMLVLGLFTPLAAAGVLGVTASATYLTREVGYFPDMVNGGPGMIPGYELPVVIGAAALALLFTGPGRIALDFPTPWRRKPVPFGLLGLLLAAAASVAVIGLFT